VAGTRLGGGGSGPGAPTLSLSAQVWPLLGAGGPFGAACAAGGVGAAGAGASVSTAEGTAVGAGTTGEANLTLTARRLQRTADSIAMPRSVNAYGSVRRPR
jgi:hypothetical protein